MYKLDPIIKSILNIDLYKITQQQAVLELYPNANVTYRFKNRGKHRFNKEFIKALEHQADWHLVELRSQYEDIHYLSKTCPYLKPAYLEYLRNYRFKPNELTKIELDKDNNLELEISGPWHSTILWETILMSIISELYFKICDTEWNNDLNDVAEKAYKKAEKLLDNEVVFADFGTRRRRSYDIHETVVRGLHAAGLVYGANNKKNTFVGTSNVYLARMLNVKPIGTIAHEAIQGISVLEGLRHANRFAMEKWIEVYGTSLGIMLTDTYTTDSFLKDFNRKFAMLFDGTRNDSGNCFTYTDKLVAHYKKLNIDPMSKTIIFSDSLDVDKAIEIKNYCEGKIKCSFGIGTHFSNDFSNSPALNIIIKLWSINNIPVVKLSDDPGKENGEQDAIDVAMWTHTNNPLRR